eukprot:GHVU01042467.1.p1 GENE.GHVU01042467.1~~GHVU01042467.1.p1  ORF type:complete len:422 (-),score=54.09 GHVU01042467.1:295-1407(-)
MSEERYQMLREKGARFQAGAQYVCGRALYGHKKAPLRWENAKADALRANGLTPVDEGIWMRCDETGTPCSVVIDYVDEFVIGEPKGERTEEYLNQRFSCNPTTNLKDGESVKFLGIKLQRQAHSLYLSLNHYLDAIEVGDKKVKKVTEVDLLPSEESAVLRDRVPEYRSKVGTFSWASKLEPKADVWVSRLSEHSLTPSQRHLDAVDRTLEALKKNLKPLQLQAVQTEPELVVYCDASYSQKTKLSRCGYQVFLIGKQENLIAWCTRRSKRLLDSSTSAELLALKLAVKHVFSYKSLVEALWRIPVKVTIKVDCLPLYNQIRMGKIAEERSMQAELDYTMQEMRKLKSDIEWISREFQRADCMTKLVWFE